MRNGFGAGNGNGLVKAAIARDNRQHEARRAEVAKDVQAGRITLGQAEDRMNGKG